MQENSNRRLKEKEELYKIVAEYEKKTYDELSKIPRNLVFSKKINGLTYQFEGEVLESNDKYINIGFCVSSGGWSDFSPLNRNIIVYNLKDPIKVEIIDSLSYKLSTAQVEKIAKAFRKFSSKQSVLLIAYDKQNDIAVEKVEKNIYGNKLCVAKFRHDQDFGGFLKRIFLRSNGDIDMVGASMLEEKVKDYLSVAASIVKKFGRPNISKLLDFVSCSDFVFEVGTACYFIKIFYNSKTKKQKS